MPNVIFLGSVPDVAQVSTITPTLTWAASDSGSLTIGGATLTVTLGTVFTIAELVDVMARMVNGDALKSDETRNSTGDLAGQFANITATSAGDTLTLTADKDDFDNSEPFIVTTSQATAGDGVMGSVSESTSHTGPYDAGAAGNWSDGAVPNASDVAILVGPDKHLRWNLQEAVPALELADLTQYADFTGDIGLPETNVRNAGLWYREYRRKRLRIKGNIILGEGDGPSSGLIRIECNDVADKNVTIYKSGSRTVADHPAIEIDDLSGSANLRITDGDIGIDTDSDSIASEAKLVVSGKSTRVQIGGVVGTGLTSVVVDASTIDVFGEAGSLIATGGATLRVHPTTDGFTGIMKLYQGSTLDHRGTQITAAVTLSSSTLTLENNPLDTVTFSAGIEIYGRGSRVIDRRNLLAGFNIDFNETNPKDHEIDIDNIRLMVAAVG